MELHTRFVDDPTSKPIQRINLPKNGTLSDPSKTWVAGTSSKVINLRSDQSRSSTGSRSSSTCFGASMSTSDYDDIVCTAGKLVGRPSLSGKDH